MADAPEPWLTVVGVDDSGPRCLPPTTLAVVEAAEVVVGGERHHALFKDLIAERLTWERPIERSLEAIEARRGRRVVVLASCDPFCFGIGGTLSGRFGRREMVVIPAPSSAALVSARLHWPSAGVEVVSLHHAPTSLLARYLWPKRRLIVLTRDDATHVEVARLLRVHGYGRSRMVILEHLGGARERIVETTADGPDPGPIAGLNVLALECAADPKHDLLPTVPGLPDQVYESDGMLTRSEVRAITLARLQPGPAHRLLDVGAGSGSIAIEWLRAAGRGQAVAVERDPARCAMIMRNAQTLGTPELEVVQGEAPGCLKGLPTADAVFVGGGLARPGLLDACYDRLRPGGRLVANAVTLEGEQALVAYRSTHGGDLLRIGIAHLEPVGRLEGWRPAMPVTQLAMSRR
ncbi:MAG: precorrin-6y C5,15-methyltransferase (decarboxylating) subunit CbiE [Geminicoccaceae bacterium]|nr:precorrin-6y C5,15-methyltransferase (decarboxylating) subunit CbiE [Geminicoccaceae bacterium]